MALFGVRVEGRVDFGDAAPPMTDRGRQVYALLRTLLAWIPPPRGGRALAEAGFAVLTRRCHACLAAGRDKPALGASLVKCDHCHGTGLISVRDRMDDPVKAPAADPRRKVYFGGESSEQRRDEARRRDVVLERLEQEQRVRDGAEAVPDELVAAVDRRDRMWRLGSYQELEAALEWLRDTLPAGYGVALGVAYQPFGEAPVEPVGGAVGAVCEVLAERMPGRIRVPAVVAVFGREELELRARVERESLWRGRSVRHELRRAERRALAVGLAADGVAPGEIGFRLGVHRRTVQRWLSESATLGGTAA